MTRLLFEPLEFLAKLAALTPRPAINLVCYHGVPGPHARWRRQVVAYGRATPESGALFPGGRPGSEGGRGAAPPRTWSWAALMRRAFGLDVLACPRCGARLRGRATIEGPVVVRRILASGALLRPAGTLGPGPPTEVPAAPD